MAQFYQARYRKHLAAFTEIYQNWIILNDSFIIGRKFSTTRSICRKLKPRLAQIDLKWKHLFAWEYCKYTVSALKYQCQFI